MITKERLEELIKQGATIYTKYRKLSLTSFEQDLGDCGGKVYRKLSIEGNGLKYTTNNEEDYFYEQTFDFTDLFETKEDAEEYLKYKNITREEKLELPTWEEFKNFKKSIIFRVLSKDITEEDDTIFQCYNNGNAIIIYNDFNSSRIFNKPLTRENYNKARDLCIKLFKGEEV